MGTWDAGNFDNDAACDVLGSVMDVLDPEIEGFMSADDSGVEDLDTVIACVAMKSALIARCGAASPTEAEAATLRDKVLAIFDREFDDLKPVAGHKEARRRVIVETLDTYVQLAAERPAP